MPVKLSPRSGAIRWLAIFRGRFSFVVSIVTVVQFIVITSVQKRVAKSRPDFPGWYAR